MANGDQYELINIPDEIFPYLPKNMQEQLTAIQAEMVHVIAPVSGELDKLNRIITSLPAMVTLRHIHNRLSKAPFNAKLDELLDHEMMTMAFVVAYCRVIKGGNGSSGVDKGQIPPHLRQAHQEIIDVRNQRYAHIDRHHSLTGAMQIDLIEGEFKVGAQFNMGYYVRGANEWRELVDFLDALTFDRIQKQIAKLKTRTNREWSFASGPTPEQHEDRSAAE